MFDLNTNTTQQQSKPIVNFFRYEAVLYASLGFDGEYESPKIPCPKIGLRTYNLFRETQKGYWIGYGRVRQGIMRGQARWVSKTSKKRFAYPTKEEALQNFLKRTERRVKILKYQLLTCEIAIEKAKYISV